MMSTSIHYYPCYQETTKNQDMIIHEFLSGMNLFLTFITMLMSYGMFCMYVKTDNLHDRVLSFQVGENQQACEENDDGDNEECDDNKEHFNEEDDDLLSVSDSTDENGDDKVSEQTDITYFS